MLLLSIVVSLFGLDRWAYSHAGINLQGMLIMCAVFGMGGSFISLAMSKWMAKMSVGAQVIAEPRNAEREMAVRHHRARTRDNAGIGMPEIAVYDAPEINAFATGMSKNHALVAVSTGLLQSMDRDQVDAVLGHEITHVANGDMVTMALIQGVLNTFVMFLARMIGALIDGAMSRQPRRQPRRRHRLLRHRDGAADRARRARHDDRDVVLALARIPRGCGRREARRPPER